MEIYKVSYIVILLLPVMNVFGSPIKNTKEEIAIQTNNAITSMVTDNAELQAHLNPGITHAIDKENVVEDVDMEEGNDMEAAESIVFRPLFRYRQRNARRHRYNRDTTAVETTTADAETTTEDAKTQEGDDMDVAESIVFRPLFRYRQRNSRRHRFNRDTTGVETTATDAETTTEDTETQEGDDMDVAESIVFRPLFRYRQRNARRHRYNRDTTAVETTTADAETTTEDAKTQEGDDMDVAESIVFRPLFRYRQRNSRRHRYNRDTTDVENKTADAETTTEDAKTQEGDNMDVAESIVFRPLFRYRQRNSRRHRFNRDTTGVETTATDAETTTEDTKTQEGDDMDVAESIVFRPLFRYRQRNSRRHRYNRDTTDVETTTADAETTTEDAKTQEGDDMDVAESIVFRPLFRYRQRNSRRHRFNRDTTGVETTATDAETTTEDTETQEGDDMDVAESIVFRPLFRYRQRNSRRHRYNRDTTDVENTTAETTTEDAETQEGDDMDVAESIVFRPLFRYRQRNSRRHRYNRDTTDVENTTADAETTTEDAETQEGDDMDVAESIVFRPLFRYRQRNA